MRPYLFLFVYREHLTGESWSIKVHYKPTARLPEEKLVCDNMDWAAITYGVLQSFKSWLGYGARDYFYYKKRCSHANDLATYEPIDYLEHVQDMIDHMESEKKRLLLTSQEEQQQQPVPITPLKKNEGKW